MVKLTFKSKFKDNYDMLGKIPSKYKQNDLIFEMYDGDSSYKVKWKGTDQYGTGVILEHKCIMKEEKIIKMFENMTDSEKSLQSSSLNENLVFKQMLNQSRKLIKEADSPTPESANIKKIFFETIKTIEDFQNLLSGTQKDDFLVPKDADSIGIDTGLKNNRKDVVYRTSGKNIENIIVPLPKKQVNPQTLSEYNSILKGDIPYNAKGQKFNFGVTFNGKEYILSTDEKPLDSKPKETQVYDEKTVNFDKIGIKGAAYPESENTGIDTGIKNKSDIKYSIAGSGQTTIIVPAPTENLTNVNLPIYQEILKGVKPYNSAGRKINFGVTFDGEEYSLLGQPEIDQASAENAPMFNFFNDRAYTYMKIGKDMYFQRRNAGKDKNDPKQYTKVNPTTQKVPYDAIAALKFTKTGEKQ